ncbi:sialate O-acetylesterase [Thioalkalivibrio sp. XN8]|uniref:sialate O-acetylesterase n=1 Tax=Thioalkalivibrio sp. XN8 TaxID=2712863 RepID=UPI0013EA49B8|nr:sialate O-acetylesterase [Thioalkalivibrio sp. XN8]NGP53673.1 sialate O-acetylesterase [Thioalkalivibrio sp. XN8]
MRTMLTLLLVGAYSLAVFGYGVGVGKYQWFPYEAIKILKGSGKEPSGLEFDAIGRLVADASKTEAKCPVQTDKLGVLLVIGQSNAANHAEYKYQSSELAGVYNYFDGKCYEASSPLLGSTGRGGEWLSRVASHLVSRGVYEEVVVVSSAITSTPVARWAAGNDLNEMLRSVVANVRPIYRVTDVVWHQGESDHRYTFTETYEAMFLSMLSTLRGEGVQAPIFLSIASTCGEDLKYPNRVTEAQTRLAQLDGVEIGVNTDELLTMEMRYDTCHFARDGQESAALELAQIIADYHTD